MADRLTEAQRRSLRRKRVHHFKLMRQAEEDAMEQARIVQRIDRQLYAGRRALQSGGAQ